MHAVRHPQGSVKMEEANENTNDALSYHYKETVRLANISDSYAKGAFADFKMLAAVGAILTWEPFYEAVYREYTGDINILFLGFVAILIMLAIVGIMNLQKLLIINFYLEQLQCFETEIRSLLGNQNSSTFRVAENWRTRASGKQMILGWIFYALFYIAAITPTYILYLNNPICYEWYIYLTIALIVIGVHIGAVVIVHKKIHQSNKNTLAYRDRDGHR